jgi:hypothetical protein
MTIIALAFCILIIGYIILAVFGVIRSRAALAFKWIGISVLSVFAVYAMFYVLQDLLPRLHQLTTPSCIVVAAATLAIGFSKVFGAHAKIPRAQQVAPSNGG